MRKFLTLAAWLLLAAPALASDNVVVLLDTSPSMDERMRSVRAGKMQAAQEALLSVLDQIPAGTNVGVLTFSGWIYPGNDQKLGPVNKQQMAAAIRNTRANGDGTPLGTYIKQAADALLEQRNKEKGYGSYKLLVVTDGEATPPSEGQLLDQYLPDILARGLVVDSIGVDMSQDHTLSRSSHSYMRADNPDSLRKAVSAALAEVGAKDDGTPDDDQFKMIAPLPEKLAAKIVVALADNNTRNYPIGEPPPVKVVDSSGNVSFVPPAQVQPTPDSDGGSGIGVFAVIGGIVVVMVIIAIVASVLKNN